MDLHTQTADWTQDWKKKKGSGDGLVQVDSHQPGTPDWENSWPEFGVLVFCYSCEAPNDMNNVEVRTAGCARCVFFYRSFLVFAWKNWVKQRSYTRKASQRILTYSPVWIRTAHHNLFPLITATEFFISQFDHLWTSDSSWFEKDKHGESQNE